MLSPPFEKKFQQTIVAAFESQKYDETDIHWAAFHLLFDVWLYLHQNHNTPTQSPFHRLGQLTAAVAAPPLVIAHCIRDIAYGDESRIDDLKALVESDDPAYRDIFVRCLWRDE